jgi:tetratricopeptide (TPR) repeat protein
MAALAGAAPPRRHPWLDALTGAPQAEVEALICGTAAVPPYGRAEPEDAAASLLFGVPEDDAAWMAFDTGCLAALGELHTRLRTSDGDDFDDAAMQAHRLLAMIRRQRPARTVRDLHTRYVHWFGVFETVVIDRGLDVRREYWRLLALTQDMADDSRQSRRLMPLWLGICGEAGGHGRYPASCLDIGLIGLRQLPLGPDHDSNEEAVCHGLARWAVRQRPDKQAFLNRWREIESAYPLSPDYWPPLVADVIAAQEGEVYGGTNGAGETFPAAAWWRDDLDLPQPRPGKPASPSERRRAIEPPPPDEHQNILRAMDAPMSQLRPRIERLLAGHRRYAEATGDVYYLVRTACNVGMRLIKANPTERRERGALAVWLARQALEHAPTNVYAWALWRDGLAAQGAVAAAETVGWEAVRRFPEDPQWRNQLAPLLADECGRPAEAERLLRETIGLFPDNVTARNQLARLIADLPGRQDEAAAILRETIGLFPDNATARTQLAGLIADLPGRQDEAAAILREAIRLFPGNAYCYTQLAMLLARHYRDRLTAIAILDRLLARQPDNAPARDLRAQITAGTPVGGSAKVRRPRAAVDSGPATDVDLPAARARRALFLVETATDDQRGDALAEVRRILAEDPGLAYVRYVAERTGVAVDGGGGTAFAIAFERAAHAADAPAAFQSLASRTPSGIYGLVAQAGLMLVSGGTELPQSPDVAGMDAGATARRFAGLATVIGTALSRPGRSGRTFLRLVSDFAAAGLSIAA